MCAAIKELYKRVYNQPFSFDSFDNRIMLQKAVYLLENMGLSIGDYSFIWDKYGPYSVALDYDAYISNKTPEKAISFSSHAEKCIDQLINQCINLKEVYSCRYWMECVAALYHLLFVLCLNDDDALKRLQEQKPYLSNDRVNKKALDIAKVITQQ